VDAGRVRSLAVSALGRSRRLSLALIREALEDPEPEVRRVVLGHLGAVSPSVRDPLVATALADSSARVAIAAVRYVAAGSRTEARCEQLVAATAPDAPPALRIVALEALARPCPSLGAQRAALVRTAAEIAESGQPWQPAARALLSLATVDTDAARRSLPGFLGHENPFVRAYAARTARAVRHVEALFDLSVDPSPNVRNEAIPGLFAIEGHGLDDFLVGQLEGDDPQLLITLAGLLENAPDRSRAALAALDAFERISGAERETWRDPRIALLERIAELGDASLADRLTPYLTDYDVAVAQAVEAVLEDWTGTEHAAEPAPRPRAQVPDLVEMRTLEGATLTLHMRDGGALVIELLADQAPTNVARAVRLARSGYYDGLTLHRWAPNFVVQGGSPGANEYQGDGPYTRDELGGMPHWRGTVGVSTRGHDTGDGQIFINLVDNPALGGDYTVFGMVVEGHEVLDGILEGAVIERAEVSARR
jgi:cyclophilin family peptidyl-prolyl cis-trans isomerase